jgi:hypothetical protein
VVRDFEVCHSPGFPNPGIVVKGGIRFELESL